ncbi:hypothetical protein [Parvibaculum sp. MBR-TMA-1.3b-4.2]|jgi:hypothetical protein
MSNDQVEETDMLVQFLDDYDFRPPERPAATVAYKKGMTMTVRRVCGEQAIAAGKATEVVRNSASAPTVSVDDGEGTVSETTDGEGVENE